MKRPIPGRSRAHRRATAEPLEPRRFLTAVRIGDVGPAAASAPGSTASDGTFAYFAASDRTAPYARHIWRTDGTAAGTVPLATVPGSVALAELTLANNHLFYTAADPDSYGRELFALDLATRALTTFHLAPPDKYNAVSDLIALNDRLYVTARDEAGLYTLYATDGTEAGTQKVFDLGPGYGNGAIPPDVARVGDELYFSAGGAGSTWTVYRSDGTTAGTQPVKTITNSARVRGFAAVNGRVLFFDAAHLWVSDGTEAGTHALSAPVGTGIYSAGPYAVFYREDRSVWLTDATDAGTRQLPLFVSEAYAPLTTASNGTLIVPGEAEAGRGPYAVTPTRTELLMKDPVSPFFPAGDRVYFDAQYNAYEPTHRVAFSDGTFDGTWMVEDLPPLTNFAPNATGFTRVAGGIVYDRDGLYFLPDDTPRLPGFSGHVFRDLDADGVYDPGEPREDLATLYPNLPVAADGSWSLRFAKRGEWAPWVQSNAEYVRPTTPTERPLNLAMGERAAGVDFGFRRVNIVRGSVKVDVNRNSNADSSEPPAPGQTVFADLDRDGVLDPGEPAAVSGADGSYELGDVPAGGVLVRVAPLPGWYAAAPIGPGVEVATTANGGLFTNFTSFAVSQTPPVNYVIARLFEDTDRDGTRDAGEPQVTTGTIWGDVDDDGVPDEGEPAGAAGTAGAYLRFVRPGTYAIRVRPAAGWVSTAPAPRLTLAPGQRVYDLQLPVAVPAPSGATLAGVVFQDDNGNGARDAGEPVRPGVRVYLDADDDFAADLADEPNLLTDSLGRFSFVNLAPGHYRVRQEVDPGWVQTTSPPGSALEVDVADGTQRTDLLLGARRATAGEVRPVVFTFFVDANVNGVQDDGEVRPPAQSFIIYHDRNNNAQFDDGAEWELSAQINSTSTVNNFAPGLYRLRFFAPLNGWRPTNFGPDGSFVASVGAAPSVPVNIGLYHPNIQVSETWYEAPRRLVVRMSVRWPEAAQAIFEAARVTAEDGSPAPAFTGGLWDVDSVTLTFAQDLPAGRYTLTIPGAALHGEAVLPTPGDYRFTFGVPPPPSAVVGRYVYYNNSAYDGPFTSSGPRDDAAVAPDKAALLPGQSASFANVTSYGRGLNGVMVDVRGLPRGTTPGADDFAVRIGNSADPAAWKPLATRPTVTVRRGAGAGGSDRVTLTWPDETIRNTWAQVTVLATPATGLAAPDVFYFGNLVGDTGPGALTVDGVDWARALSALATPNPTARGGNLDINRDRVVDNRDAALVRRNLHRRLATFTAPPAADTAPVAATTTTPFTPPPAPLTRRRPDDRTILRPALIRFP
jgi:ELWxxDGT repeat protein